MLQLISEYRFYGGYSYEKASYATMANRHADDPG